MWVVTLTAAQANTVRGKFSETEALDPQQLADGTWFLPVRCLIPFLRNRPVLTALLLARARRSTVATDFVGSVDPADLAKVEVQESVRFRNLDTGTPIEATQA